MLMMAKKLALMWACFVLLSCSGSDGWAEFCGYKARGMSRGEGSLLVQKNNLSSKGNNNFDGVSNAEILQGQGYTMLVRPFPLFIPEDKTLKEYIGKIGDYSVAYQKYNIRDIGISSTTLTSINEKLLSGSSITIYSDVEGVISIHNISEGGEMSYEDHLHKCGEERILITDIIKRKISRPR